MSYLLPTAEELEAIGDLVARGDVLSRMREAEAQAVVTMIRRAAAAIPDGPSPVRVSRFLESPQKRIRSVIARRSKIEDAAVRQQVALLKALRRDILARMATAQGYGFFRLEQMLHIVDSEVKQYGRKATIEVSNVIRGAWGAGKDLVAATVNVPDTMWHVSPQLLRSMIDVTSDQTRGIWSELGSRLKTQVRQVTLGVTDPYEAIGRVAKLVQKARPFDNAEASAECILRTEVNRVFSMAVHDNQMTADKAAKELGQRLMKYWLTAGDHRVRDAHVAAGKAYSKAKPIPIDEPFIVDGEELMYPGDPAGSAANTIQCRCTQLTVVVSVEKYAALARAA